MLSSIALRNSSTGFRAGRLQTVQCVKREEKVQPLAERVVILPSWLPHHFDGLAVRTGTPLLFGRKTSYSAHPFLERNITSQVFCPRYLQAFSCPVLAYAPLWLQHRSLRYPSVVFCLRSFNHTEAKGFLRSSAQGSSHISPSFLCHRLEL